PNASMSTQPLVLIIEPFYGGSHRQLIDYLTGEILPPGCWASGCHVRLRSGTGEPGASALHVAQQFSHLFCSSVLSLAELVGLCPCLAATKKLVYFHENQLVYPVRKMREARERFPILTALAADLVLFNSRHNMDTFLHGIDSFLNAMPDYRTRGLWTIGFLILWPHRWEHDKNPDSFFTAIFALADSGETNFALCILGQSFAGPPPPAFEAAKKRLPSDQIAHWGYLENRQVYLACLSACHVVVSTAEHESFWFSHARSHIRRRCYPLAPRRLAYPELFPSDCLYNTDASVG
uniref:tRNA-queuosine alpha-mannosyltransferase n=1 Tax=Macrostomum lignano TaxID=282301 RepID=A0A1I8F6I2_9PLAT